MSFYNPDGSGNVHTPKAISGSKPTPNKTVPAKIVKVAKKTAAAKKAVKKTTKKAK